MFMRLLVLLALSAVSPSAIAAIPNKPYEALCRGFFAKTARFEEKLPRKPNLFPSPAVALKELRAASDYPGFPEENAKILKEALASKGAESEISRLREAGQGCDPTRYYAWATRLIDSARVYRFHRRHKNELASALVGHFRQNALEPRPVLQELLDLKLLRHAAASGIFKLSQAQERKLAAAQPRIKDLSAKALAREAKIETLRARVGEPPDSALEKRRLAELSRFDWEQLLNSEELRAILREILDFIDED